MADVSALSELTTKLALDYLDRLKRPLSDLEPSVGVTLVGHAYAAHLAVEADPGAYGAADIPVLGTLPARVPQDLLARVVKASRRPFPGLCAVPPATWQGYVACRTAWCHTQGRVDHEGGWLDPAVVDGLARFGWVLRQVDLHYGLGPAGPA